jgi:hypothetical protein
MLGPYKKTVQAQTKLFSRYVEAVFYAETLKVDWTPLVCDAVQGTQRGSTTRPRSALVLPVAETWALVPQVEYRDQRSNYDLYQFDDLTALVGVQKRF